MPVRFSSLLSRAPAARSRAVLVASLVLAAALTGCAGGLQRTTGSLPAPEVLSALPVIKLGQPKPQGEYIVYLPASEPVTAEAKVQGNLFEKTDSKTLSVTLKRDVYLYKNWVSYDKVHWAKDRDSVSGRVDVRLPGYDAPMPGELLIEFNTKAPQ